MKFSIDVDVDIKTNKLEGEIQNNRKFWLYAASEWHRLISPWIPYKTGKLMNDVSIEPKKITYNAPYAKYVYYNTKANFNKNIHPLATSKWDEAAKPSQESKLYQSLQEMTDNGVFDFND